MKKLVLALALVVPTAAFACPDMDKDQAPATKTAAKAKDAPKTKDAPKQDPAKPADTARKSKDSADPKPGDKVSQK